VSLSVCSCIYSGFFFQAEDGIRDRNVTGVQTCALPISATVPAAGGAKMAVITLREMLNTGVHFGHQTSRWNPKMQRFILTERNRSEERRVGKECRSRWSRDDGKQKADQLEMVDTHVRTE